jgi:hypothetical protein
LDSGFTIAAGFFALGILWIFIGNWAIGIIEFCRRLLG